MKTKKKCSVTGCDGVSRSGGMCSAHYSHFQRYGNLEIRPQHGMRFTPEYKAWSNMKSRCYRVKDISYPRYGGRGITVCKKWRESFTAFYLDMGNMPIPGMQLDRINSDGNYDPENCRWATRKDNVRNREVTKLDPGTVYTIKRLHMVGIKGAEIARWLDLSASLVQHILHGDAWTDIKIEKEAS